MCYTLVGALDCLPRALCFVGLLLETYLVITPQHVVFPLTPCTQPWEEGGGGGGGVEEKGCGGGGGGEGGAQVSAPTMSGCCFIQPGST